MNLILKLWTEPKVSFKGKYYHANGAVLDPKPQQKPQPPVVFGGVGPRMLKMAGRYADVCLVPRFPGVNNAKSRKIVMEEAQRAKREGKLSFVDMAPFPEPGSMYNSRDYSRLVENALEAGCKYFIATFPHMGFIDNLRDFAKNIIPSFAAQETLRI